MTKQEEIQEGMADILEVWMDRDLALATARTIMAKEHHQGVVIKVERELPVNYQRHLDETPESVKREIETPSDLYIYYKGAVQGQSDMAGYEAVEPLIK